MICCGIQSQPFNIHWFLQLRLSPCTSITSPWELPLNNGFLVVFIKFLKHQHSTIYSQHICWNSQLIVCWNWFQFYGKPNDFLWSQIALANVCNPTFIQYKTEQFTIHFLLCTFLSALLKSPPWRVPLNHAYSRFYNTGISRSSLGSSAMQPLCSAPLTKAVDWNQLIVCRHRFKLCW